MKFFINALLVSGALANSVYKRQGTTIAQVGADISGLPSKVEAVGKAVEAFNGDAQQAVALQSAAKELTEAVTKGTADAKGLPELKQEDALGVAQPVQELEKAINSTIDSVIAKKDLFVKAGLGGAVHEILWGQAESAKAFTDALLGKLPAELQPIGQQLAAPVAASIKRGVDAFAGLSGSVASATAALSSTSEDTSSQGPPSGTAGGYGPPPSAPSAPKASNTTTPIPYGRGNQTNTTVPITPYTGAAPSTTAASAASAFGISAVVALVALAAL